eukprot:SAG31_NODE_300_length_18109_cov_47.887285_14_plen_134_part_00
MIALFFFFFSFFFFLAAAAAGATMDEVAFAPTALRISGAEHTQDGFLGHRTPVFRWALTACDSCVGVKQTHYQLTVHQLPPTGPTEPHRRRPLLDTGKISGPSQQHAGTAREFHFLRSDADYIWRVQVCSQTG